MTVIEENDQSVLNNPCLTPQWLSSVLADQKLYPFGFEAIMIPKWWTVSLFYFITIKRASENMLVEGGVVVILKRKRKVTERDPLEF